MAQVIKRINTMRKSFFTVNGLKFARTAHFFNSDCVGYFREIKAGIQLFDEQREIQGLICNTDSVFFVTAFKFVSTTRYMNAATDKSKKLINTVDLNHKEEREILEQALNYFYS